MASSMSTCCGHACSLFLAVINALAMIFAALLLLLGVLLLWGYQLMSALHPAGLAVLDSVSQQLGTALGTSDIKARLLFKDVASLTMPAGVACLALSFVVMVTACVGCCPATCCRRKRRRPLIAYIVLVIALFSVQSIFLLYAFTNSAQLKQHAKTRMQASFAKFTGADCSNLESLLINLMQIFVGCCGVTNGTDFHTLRSAWKRERTVTSSSANFTYNMTYPMSCCKFNTTSMKKLDTYCNYNNTNTATNWYQTGCFDKLITMLESAMDAKALVIGIVCLMLTQWIHTFINQAKQFTPSSAPHFQLLLVLGAAILVRAPPIPAKSNRVAPAPSAVSAPAKDPATQ